MAITYVGAGTGAGSGGSITPTLPSGWAVDDIFLLMVETRDGQTPDPVTGWTQAANQEGFDDTEGTLFWRRAEAGDSNPTVDDSGNHTIGLITAWRGCKTTGNPWEALQTSTDTSQNTSVTATGVTTSGTDRMIVLATCTGDNSTYSGWSCTSLESTSEAAEFNSSAGSDGMVGFGYGIKATAGATGNFTATVSTSEYDVNFVLALVPAATDTEVNTNVDALILTEQAASIAHDIDVSTNVDALILTEQAASVGLNVDISTNVDALILSTSSATIVLDVDVGTNVDALILTEQQATIVHDVNVNTNLDTLTLTELQASVALDVDISTNVDALILTEQAATITNPSSGTNVNTNVDALILTEQQASVAHDRNVTTAVDALILTELQASVANDYDITAGTDALVLTELAAGITFDVEVLGNVDALVLTELAASVANDIVISAGLDALILTELAATITNPVTGTNVNANTDTLTLTEQQASVAHDINVTSGTAALLLTEYQSNVVTETPLQARLNDYIALYYLDLLYDLDLIFP